MLLLLQCVYRIPTQVVLSQLKVGLPQFISLHTMNQNSLSSIDMRNRLRAHSSASCIPPFRATGC